MKRVYKKSILFVVLGGIIGFAIHLIWHSRLDIPLFSFASHVIRGTLYTAIGMIIGLLVWYLLRKRI